MTVMSYKQIVRLRVWTAWEVHLQRGLYSATQNSE